MTYAPGPWKQHPADRFIILGADGSTVGIQLGDIAHSIPNADNARLIAAAPELLEAVKTIINNNGTGAMEWAISNANRVIAKAEGRET